MNLKVLVSGSVVAAAALILYVTQQPVSVHKSHESAPAAVANDPQTPAQPAIQTPDLNLQNKGRYSTSDKHQHSTETLPDELAADVERRRRPSSELTLHPVAGGYSMPANGQYHTVVMAFIGEDGKLHRSERQVTPIPDASLTLPPPPATATQQ